MASHTPISSSRKIVAIAIMALQMTLFAAAFDSDVNIMAPQTPPEQHGDEPCHLEPRFDRLRMTIPRHLQPKALQSGSCGVGNEDTNQGNWLSCPEDKTNRPRSDFYLGLHCGDMELLFSLYNADELAGHPQDFFGFDYESWCNCSNYNSTNARNGDCNLCSNGMIMKQSFHDSIFNSETADQRFQLTCAEAAEYARHITNKEKCQDTLDQARAFCCETQSTQQSSSPPPPSCPMSIGDVQVTVILMLAVTGVSSLLVHGSLRALEFIDDRWFSWEDM